MLVSGRIPRNSSYFRYFLSLPLTRSNVIIGCILFITIFLYYFYSTLINRTRTDISLLHTEYPVIPSNAVSLWYPPELISSSTDLVKISAGEAILSTRSLCYPFLFPRPESNLFITAWPNHGAGLGHQMGEWLYGPYLAYTFNITYVHTGFLRNAGRWSSWLGFGSGEDSEEDLIGSFSALHLIERKDTDHYSKDNTLTMNQWMESTIQDHKKRTAEKLIADHQLLSSKSSFLPLPDINTEATLIRIYRIHVPTFDFACHPPLNKLLRQKYCAARINAPDHQDFYSSHRDEGRLIVAFHLRCGDACYDKFRATPFPSVIKTIRLMSDTLVDAGYKVAFHIFSQPPRDNTAENHFRPVLEAKELNNIVIESHFHAHAHTTLHHLVSSDVMIGSQSSFSWVGALLHHTVSMGPVETCQWTVPDYKRESGEFNTKKLLIYINESKPFQPKFASINDCYDII